MKKVTFIHAADLHLDSPMIGLKNLPERIFKKLQESTFEALGKIVDAAIIHQVNFVILAGDLFDGEDRSIRAQARLRKEMERLEARNIAVFAVHGNHDHLEGVWTHLPLPKNVQLFSHEVEALKYTKEDGTSVHLYGFSYPKRHLFTRMVPFYVKEEGADFHIGILHGHIEGSSEHAKYAPFTLKELLHKEFDYWALGHIHKRQDLSTLPPVVYPGNIQGRHRKETGMKGCYLVHLSEAGCIRNFIATSVVIWDEKELDASNLNSFHDIYTMCKNIIEEKRAEKIGTILSLTIKNVNIPEQDYKAVVNGELLDVLQEEEKEEEHFVWISKLSAVESKKWWSREQLEKDSAFYSELFKIASNKDELNKSIVSLYNHPVARRFLEDLPADEKNKLAIEAEELLVSLLNLRE
ncbi:DNA repair exonuclease [Bacillus sp. Bva_UNVM-123]|uniref:exonuclease SbcCD subunit D n=1 Tax=Bacillus sp. Bva_UNVM-123 TaxID=2829798 RepID=UPI00391F44BF